MDSRAGRIELFADERIVGRNTIGQFGFEIFGSIGNRGGVNAVRVPFDADILDDESFDGSIPCPFTEAQQRAVRAAAPIEPGRGGIDDHFVKIIVTVPFKQMSGNPGVINEGSNQFRNTPREGRPGIGNAESQSVAKADLYVDPAFFSQPHQFQSEGNAKTKDIGPGDIFKMAPGDDPSFQGCPDNPQIFLQNGFAVALEFQEDMIIGNRRKDARFFQAHLRHQLEVLLHGPNPAVDLRIAVTLGKTQLDRLTVFLGVEEEFRLADYPIWTGKPVEKIEDGPDLFHRIGRPSLLAIAESGVGDKDVFRRVNGQQFVVEVDPRHFIVREDFSHQIGARDVEQTVLPVFGMLVIQNPFLIVPAGHEINLP